MTGVFYVRKARDLSKRDKFKMLVSGNHAKYEILYPPMPEGEPMDTPSPDFEAIDFYANGALHTMIYEAACKMRTGERLEIVCELEE